MALKGKIDYGEINRQVDNLYTRMVNSFLRAGEEFIKNAREQMQSHAMGTYEDQTTNLRNSIGYFVILNGEIVYENNLMHTQNIDLIRDLIKPQGIQLIGIA